MPQTKKFGNSISQTARTTSPLDKNARTCTTEPEETKHPILQRRRLVAERPSVRGWQDLRAVHDSRGLCSESGPFMARSSRGVFPNGCLRGFSDTRRRYAATNWRFSRPRPLSGCMERKTCHGLPPGNAPRRNLATAKRPGTHRARTLSPSDAGGTHFAGILPSASARERIRTKSCHRQAPTNKPMKNLHNRHLTIVYKTLTRNQAEYNKEIGF